MLKEALQKQSLIDGEYWEDLKKLHCIYSSDNDSITGALAYGIYKDNTGVILWSHNKEDPETTQALIKKALNELKDCDLVEAFPHANALGILIGRTALEFKASAADNVF